MAKSGSSIDFDSVTFSAESFSFEPTLMETFFPHTTSLLEQGML